MHSSAALVMKTMDDSSIARQFLEETGASTSSEPVMRLVEMRAYVRGRSRY